MVQILDMKMKRNLICFLGLLILAWGCSYTIRSTSGNRISAAQVQEIKLGKTTEMDLFKLLGPPSQKERKPDGTEELLYTYSQVESPTLPGGFVIDVLGREKEEVFEIVLKDGFVQNYHFLKQ